MSKRTRVILIVGVLVVVAYFAYRWYQNRQASNAANPASGTTLGSNLNSPAPILYGADESGDNSAPSYSAGSETVNVTLPNGDSSTSGSSTAGGAIPGASTTIPGGIQPGGPMKQAVS